jgi:hypothetical protein
MKNRLIVSGNVRGIQRMAGAFASRTTFTRHFLSATICDTCHECADNLEELPAIRSFLPLPADGIGESGTAGLAADVSNQSIRCMLS